MVLNFATTRKIKVIALVRRQSEQLDLKVWGAAEVVELSKLATGLSEKIAIDCVRGAIAGDLIRSLAIGETLDRPESGKRILKMADL